MASGTKRTLTSARALLGFLAVGLVVSWVLTGGRASVGAAPKDTEVSGTISLEKGGQASLTDGSTTYQLISGMDFSPFVERKVVLGGGIDGNTFYVRSLSLGGISLEDEGGKIIFRAMGSVDKAGSVYQMSIEGVAFTLVGSNEFDEVLGKDSSIEGELIGTWVTLASLRTTEGKTIATEPPDLDEADTENVGDCCNYDDG